MKFYILIFLLGIHIYENQLCDELKESNNPFCPFAVVCSVSRFP